MLHAAEEAQLDLAQFQAALTDPACLERLAADLKLSHLPGPEEALAFWHEFRQVVVDRSFILEIKRPH
jgi:hypothetical protein